MVFGSVGIVLDLDHRALAALVGDYGNSVWIPGQSGNFRANTEIVVNATDPLCALPECREKAKKLLAVHSDPVVYNSSAIYAQLLDGLPLDPELYLRGVCFERVLQQFPSPLIITACFEHTVDEY